MSATARPRRSMLYMPGSNTRALEKARTLAADALILDLEDAVAPDAKDEARANVVVAARAGYGRREVLIRTNGLTTAWGRADVEAAASSGADGVLLPKVESAETVLEAEAILKAAGAPESLLLWCMIETPKGVLRAESIAAATPRLGGFVLGTSDLAKDLRCLHTPQRLPFIASLNISILAARAYGLAVLDGVYLNLDDEAGFRAACEQGRELGFDGKTLIHPKTIAVANEVFAPSPADLAWAERIIAAYGEAQAQGKGVVVVDGKLIENLHVADAQRLLAEAEAIAALAA